MSDPPIRLSRRPVLASGDAGAFWVSPQQRGSQRSEKARPDRRLSAATDESHSPRQASARDAKGKLSPSSFMAVSQSPANFRPCCPRTKKRGRLSKRRRQARTAPEKRCTRSSARTTPGEHLQMRPGRKAPRASRSRRSATRAARDEGATLRRGEPRNLTPGTREREPGVRRGEP